MFDLLRQNPGFIERSRQILERPDRSGRAKPSIRSLHQELEKVSAALLLEELGQARECLNQYIADWKRLLDDEAALDARIEPPEYDQADTTATVYTAVCDALYISIAAGLRKETGKMTAAGDSNALRRYIGPCENYLLRLDAGEASAAESERLDHWQDWLDDELVFEEDERWPLAVSLARREPDAFVAGLARWSHAMRTGILENKVHPYTYKFSDYVLGLEGAALISLARRAGFSVDGTFVEGCGFHHLRPER